MGCVGDGNRIRGGWEGGKRWEVKGKGVRDLPKSRSISSVYNKEVTIGYILNEYPISELAENAIVG